MADRTGKLELKYIVANQSQKEVTINEDLNLLDMLVQATAKGIANAPPASPAEGEMYIIGDAPTGTWEGKAKHLAGFFAGVWLIVAPRAGWRVWLEEGTAMRYQGGRWTDEGAGLDDKAPLASPALTGKPTAPTAAKGTKDTQIATTEYVVDTLTNGVTYSATRIRLNDTFDMEMHWEAKEGQPINMWGNYLNAPHHAYVFNPRNFHVNNSDRLGGLTLDQLLAEVDRRIAAKHP